MFLVFSPCIDELKCNVNHSWMFPTAKARILIIPTKRYHLNDHCLFCLFVGLLTGLHKYCCLSLPKNIKMGLGPTFPLHFEIDLGHCLDNKKSMDFPI